MIYNNLRAELYARSSTTRIIDPSGDLDRVRDVQFDTFYPGGLYGQCSFTARRKLVEWWALQGAYRLALVNGQTIVWEGLVDNLQAQMAGPNEQVKSRGPAGGARLPCGEDGASVGRIRAWMRIPG